MSDATVSSPLPPGSAAPPLTNNAAPALTYTMGAQTDVGVRRSANEDAVTLPQIAGTDAVFIVADGMGGLAAGDIASGTAVRTVEASLAEQLALDHAPAPVSPDLALLEALRRANDDVFRMTQAKRAQMVAEAGEAQTERSSGGNSGAASVSNALMGTTCVAGIVKNNTLHLAHAGDSRAYLLRNGRLSRLTDDHSFVAERVKAGDMTEGEARISRFRNMITRAIGIDATVQPDLSQTALAPGDTVLACSDGLTTMLDDDEIADLLSAPQTVKLPPDRAATLLVDAANKRGGHDNVTVMILRVHGDGTANATFATPPAAQTATRAQTASGATKSARSGGGSVLDVDTMGDKRRRKGPSFAVAALSTLGIATVLGGALLAAAPPLRTQFAALLLGGRDEVATPDQKPPIKNAGPLVDYRKLTYGPAEDFGDYLARADILSYAPSKGLYFVAGNSGKIALLSRSGAALKSVGELPDMPPPPPNPVPPSRQFITSDAQGNVYVSYTGKRIVEKRGADGRLLATIRGFDRPEAIAVDENGNLYVIDYNQIKILRARLPDAPAADASAAASGSGGGKPGEPKPATETKPASGNGASKPISVASPRPGV